MPARLSRLKCAPALSLVEVVQMVAAGLPVEESPGSIGYDAG